jgi:NosR/NirI family nitrous oxide reductase transcriptional regulator
MSGEFRFPPPEFESGHQLPITQSPAPRELLLQYLDIGVLLAALATATWLIYKRRSRKGALGLSIFSVIYFGFWRKGCVCSIGSLQNVALALGDHGYVLPVGVLAFFILPLVFALFAGRSFCAGVCPHGALQDLMLLKPLKVPAWLEQGLSVLPFIYLGAGVLFACTGSAFLICQYDPFVTVFRMNGPVLIVAAGIALMLLGIFVGRPYCRFLCPYGALLKVGSILSKWRVRVTPDYCTQCRLCEASCPFGAMREPESGTPEDLPMERRRLGRLIALLPVLLMVGAWVGWRFSGVAAQMHPTVQLATLFLREQAVGVKPGLPGPDEFALERAKQNPKELLVEAARVEKRFAIGSSIFGAWIALVIGVKLITLSVRRQRIDYEPDRGSCLACARCFEWCPNELVRRGMAPGSAASAPIAAAGS